MKSYKVVLSTEARTMLISHIRFLASVNPDAAENVRAALMAEIRRLNRMPERFPYLDVNHRRSLYRKMYVPNNYLVIYVIEDDTVYVEYILDCRQDYSWLID